MTPEAPLPAGDRGAGRRRAVGGGGSPPLARRSIGPAPRRGLYPERRTPEEDEVASQDVAGGREASGKLRRFVALT
jgi:hypothetical protein